MVLKDDIFMRVRVTSKGDWSKTEKYLKKQGSSIKDMVSIMEDYGRKGVAALASATPVETGKTASSWDYRIDQTSDHISLIFTNNNETKTGIPIVILLQYGHGNGHGVYVRGTDFINPAIKPIFDEIEEKMWKEVTTE